MGTPGRSHSARSPEEKGGHTLHEAAGEESQLRLPQVCWACRFPLFPGWRQGPPAPCLSISQGGLQGKLAKLGWGRGLEEKPTSQELPAPTGAGASHSQILRKHSQVHAETEALDVNNTPRQPRNPYELPGCLQCSRTGSVRKSKVQG